MNTTLINLIYSNLTSATLRYTTSLVVSIYFFFLYLFFLAIYYMDCREFTVKILVDTYDKKKKKKRRRVPIANLPLYESFARF